MYENPKKDVYLVRRPYPVNYTPTARILRDGTRQENLRTAEMWASAFRNHKRVSHGGKESETCNGCRELRQRIESQAELLSK